MESSSQDVATSSTPLFSHSSSKTSKPGSRKIKRWQEIVKSSNNEMEIMTVIDKGLRTSSRRKETRTSSKNKNTNKNRKQQNKPESQQEVAIDSYQNQKNNKQPRTDSLAREKMTTPTKVKNASTNGRQTRGQESPRTLTLKRLNTLKKTPVRSRTCLSPRKPENPRVKFNILLSKWKEMSNLALTPAVEKLPRSNSFVEGQSREVLENTFEKTSVLPLDAKSDFDEVSQGTAN